MPFPTLGVLDTFTYSDGDLSTVGSASWATPVVSGGVDAAVSSGIITYKIGGSSAYWKTQVGPDCEVYIDLTAVASGDTYWMGVFGRVSNPGTASMGGYLLKLLKDGEIYVCKYTNNSSADLAYFPLGGALAAGDKAGMEITTVGGNARISPWYKRAAGSWTALVINGGSDTFIDDASSPYLSAGYIGVGIYDDFAWQLDNFGGGTIGGGGPYSLTPDAASQVLTGIAPIKGFGIYVPTSKKLGT